MSEASQTQISGFNPFASGIEIAQEGYVFEQSVVADLYGFFEDDSLVAEVMHNDRRWLTTPAVELTFERSRPSTFFFAKDAGGDIESPIYLVANSNLDDLVLMGLRNDNHTSATLMRFDDLSPVKEHTNIADILRATINGTKELQVDARRIEEVRQFQHSAKEVQRERQKISPVRRALGIGTIATGLFFGAWGAFGFNGETSYESTDAASSQLMPKSFVKDGENIMRLNYDRIAQLDNEVTYGADVAPVSADASIVVVAAVGSETVNDLDTVERFGLPASDNECAVMSTLTQREGTTAVAGIKLAIAKDTPGEYTSQTIRSNVGGFTALERTTVQVCKTSSELPGAVDATTGYIEFVSEEG